MNQEKILNKVMSLCITGSLLTMSIGSVYAGGLENKSPNYEGSPVGRKENEGYVVSGTESSETVSEEEDSKPPKNNFSELSPRAINSPHKESKVRINMIPIVKDCKRNLNEVDPMETQQPLRREPHPLTPPPLPLDLIMAQMSALYIPEPQPQQNSQVLPPFPSLKPKPQTQQNSHILPPFPVNPKPQQPQPQQNSQVLPPFPPLKPASQLQMQQVVRNESYYNKIYTDLMLNGICLYVPDFDKKLNFNFIENDVFINNALDSDIIVSIQRMCNKLAPIFLELYFHTKSLDYNQVKDFKFDENNIKFIIYFCITFVNRCFEFQSDYDSKTIFKTNIESYSIHEKRLLYRAFSAITLSKIYDIYRSWVDKDKRGYERNHSYEEIIKSCFDMQYIITSRYIDVGMRSIFDSNDFNIKMKVVSNSLEMFYKILTTEFINNCGMNRGNSKPKYGDIDEVLAGILNTSEYK